MEAEHLPTDCAFSWPGQEHEHICTLIAHASLPHHCWCGSLSAIIPTAVMGDDKIGISINQWCERHAVRQKAHMVKGWVLFFPRTKLIMVPTEVRHNGWACVVVSGNATYPVGGYDLYVSNQEIERAIRIPPAQLFVARISDQT